MRILALFFLSMPLSQFSNILVILVGGGILYVEWIIRHTRRAKGQALVEKGASTPAG